MCSVSSQIFYRNISEKIVQYFSVIIPLLCHLICSGLTHSDTMSISFSSDLEISILRSLQFKISTWKKTSSCCFCSIFSVIIQFTGARNLRISYSFSIMQESLSDTASSAVAAPLSLRLVTVTDLSTVPSLSHVSCPPASSTEVLLSSCSMVLLHQIYTERS